MIYGERVKWKIEVLGENRNRRLNEHFERILYQDFPRGKNFFLVDDIICNLLSNFKINNIFF